MWKTIYLTYTGKNARKTNQWQTDDESFKTYFFGRRRFNKFLKNWEKHGGNFRLIRWEQTEYEEHVRGLWHKKTNEFIEWGDVVPYLDIVINREYDFKRDIARRKCKKKNNGELLQVIPIIAKRPKIIIKQSE